MTRRRTFHFLIPMFALGLTLALATHAHAQDASMHVTFDHSPRWVGVQGTSVREIRTADRPDYDMFRYHNRYYAYNNNRWYSSRRASGNFTAMDDRNVPAQLSRVPKDHWHNYPSGWDKRNGQMHHHDDMQRH